MGTPGPPLATPLLNNKKVNVSELKKTCSGMFASVKEITAHLVRSGGPFSCGQ